MTIKVAASKCWLFFCAALFGLTHTTAAVYGDEPAVAPSPPVTVELWVAELSVPALKGLGIDTDKDQIKRHANGTMLELAAPPKMPPEIARNSDQVLDSLKAKKAIRILAEPKVTTRSGQPASLAVGPMKMGATPTVMDDGKIRVMFHIEISKLTKPVDPVTKLPGQEISRCDGALEVEPGQAVFSAPAIPAIINGKPSADRFQIIVLRVTPAPAAPSAQATADRKGTFAEVAPSKTR